MTETIPCTCDTEAVCWACDISSRWAGGGIVPVVDDHTECESTDCECMACLDPERYDDHIHNS